MRTFVAGAALAAFMIGSPAKAAEVDFSTVITDLSGKPLKSTGDKDLTLAEVASTALLGMYSDEPPLSGVDKVRRFALALRISEGGKVDLNNEQIGTIKGVVEKAYSTLVTGRSFQMLDPSGTIQIPVIPMPPTGPRSLPSPVMPPR
jgi:hypothetical protein